MRFPIYSVFEIKIHLKTYKTAIVKKSIKFKKRCAIEKTVYVDSLNIKNSF